MLLLLARFGGGAVDQRESVAAYLADPGVVFVGGLALGGLVLLAARRELLPLLTAGSFLLILPAANPKFQTLLTGLLDADRAAAVGCAACRWSGWRCWRGSAGPRFAGGRSLAALMVGMLLAALALASLDRYYRRAFDDDTNERILRLVGQIRGRPSARGDDSGRRRLGAELPGTGVTELRGLEYLLTFARAPYRLVSPVLGGCRTAWKPADRAGDLERQRCLGGGGRVRVESLDPARYRYRAHVRLPPVPAESQPWLDRELQSGCVVSPSRWR